HPFGKSESPQTQRANTGPESSEGTDGKVDSFVAGIGTGGTIPGGGGSPESQHPDVKGIAVGASDSPTRTGGLAGPHTTRGPGRSVVPDILDRDVYEEVIDVTLAASVNTARALGTDEGILAGFSGRAAVWAAAEVAARPDNVGKKIVVVIP